MNIPKSLSHIYSLPHTEGGLNPRQREYLHHRVIDVLSGNTNLQEQYGTYKDMTHEDKDYENTTNDIIIQLLRHVSSGYSSGGISRGRSVRSLLLETSIEAFERGDEEKTKKLLSVLLAMYHDPEYVDTHKWFDYKVEYFTETGSERSELVMIGTLLGIDELPDISNITDEKILEMVYGNIDSPNG